MPARGISAVKKSFQRIKGLLIANNLYDMNYLAEYKGSDGVQFMAALAQMCSQLGIDPEALLFIMWKESDMNPQAMDPGPNPAMSAVGLIQFEPPTAQGLGTSTTALYSMTGTQQLQYVQQYLQNIKKTYGSNSLPDLPSLYLSIFYPYALDQPMDYILGSESTDPNYPSVVAADNPTFDIGKKGYIQKIDMWTWLAQNYTQS